MSTHLKYTWSLPHRRIRSPMATRKRGGQTDINRFFYIQKPKYGLPVSLVHSSTQQGVRERSEEQRPTPLQFATILDLPYEVWLLILDHLRPSHFEQIDCPVFSFQPNQPVDGHRVLLFDPARRLYTVCKRIYHLLANIAFETIGCVGTTSLHRLKTTLEKQEGWPAEQVK